jgi:hypothetical protein
LKGLGLRIRRPGVAPCRQNVSCFISSKLFPCLSRACLGKILGVECKMARKKGVSAP